MLSKKGSLYVFYLFKGTLGYYFEAFVLFCFQIPDLLYTLIIENIYFKKKIF